MDGLSALKGRHAPISDVRGMGLLCAVEFDSGIGAAVVAACNENGLLLNMVKPNAVRLMPPLTVSESEIDQAVELLRAGIAAAA